MRITKHEHACLRLESEGQTLIIDPGMFTTSLDDLHDVVAIILTHEHADHWTPALLAHLHDQFPSAPIFGPEGVTRASTEVAITTVHPGDTVTAGTFTLQFFGGVHAIIHESIPVVDNVGVLVNEAFYYAGDSYAVPEGVAVDMLAAPAGAPWLKIGDAIDFVLAVAPRRCFATHDMTLSPAGLGMHRARLEWATVQGGGEFLTLNPGDTVTL